MGFRNLLIFIIGLCTSHVSMSQETNTATEKLFTKKVIDGGYEIKVTVNVEPTYLEDHSNPSEDSYLWAYKVKITNNSKDTVKLISRHWQIFDSNGNHREVTGQGVVGEQPIIEPGDEFEYTSGTPLKTTQA